MNQAPYQGRGTGPDLVSTLGRRVRLLVGWGQRHAGHQLDLVNMIKVVVLGVDVLLHMVNLKH